MKGRHFPLFSQLHISNSFRSGVKIAASMLAAFICTPCLCLLRFAFLYRFLFQSFLGSHQILFFKYVFFCFVFFIFPFFGIWFFFFFCYLQNVCCVWDCWVRLDLSEGKKNASSRAVESSSHAVLLYTQHNTYLRLGLRS
jgi:hypothetical protein